MNRSTRNLIALVLALFFLIFLVLKFISFFVFILGSALVVVGYVIHKRNAQRNQKRKAPKILMIIGIILALGGCGGMLGGSDEESTQKDKTETVIATDEEEFDTQQFITTTPQRTKEEKQDVQLVKVIDGDTIKILYNGKKETLNYLLINTPDLNKACSQSYAKSAFKKNEDLVLGKDLQIKFEQDHKKRDENGALIAYVFADNELVQKALLDEGYALLTAVDNVAYEYLDILQGAETNAKDQVINIWSKNGYVQNNKFKKCKPAKKAQHTSEQKKDAASGENKKENDRSAVKQTQTQNNSETSKQNSTPSQPTYFSNCTELRAVYPNGVPSSHPAYQSKMDRDKDGTACEAY